ncbi:unnamed protein product, partial [Brenthis ino]
MSPDIKQSWTVMGVLLNMFGQGMVLSFPSVLLPALLKPESDIRVDLYTASWHPLSASREFLALWHLLFSWTSMDESWLTQWSWCQP